VKQFPQIFENLGATSRFLVSQRRHENHTEDPQTLHAMLQNKHLGLVQPCNTWCTVYTIWFYKPNNDNEQKMQYKIII